MVAQKEAVHCEKMRDFGQTVEDSSAHSETETTDGTE